MTLDSKHEAFTRWAQDQGVVINGIEPARLPGKGIGIVAMRKLKKGESLVTIPASALITHDTDFVRRSGFARGTVYGTVAAALTLNHANEDRWYRVWQDVWPSREDMETSMPLCWTADEQDSLMPAAKALLKHQRGKYDADFLHVGSKIPEDLRDWYMYYWLIVNTRCFYWEYFKRAQDMARRGKKLARDECLALVPWGDYFNHEDQGCQVTEDARGAVVVCDKNYKKGEEVVVSYGAHSNDYLLVEYGFVLATNKHDCTTVDHVLLAMLTPAQQELLEQHHYLGDYYLTSSGLCYRTQVAIRTMVTSGKRMEQFLADEYDGEKEAAKMDAKCREICRLFRNTIEEGLSSTGASLKKNQSHAMQTLKTRWTQLSTMLDKAEAQMFN